MRANTLRLAPGTFLGKVLHQIGVSGLTLTESAYSPTAQLPHHGHHHAYFSLVVAGSYTERVGGKSCVRPLLSVAFHPCGEEHTDDFDARESRTFSIEMPTVWTKRLQDADVCIDRPMQWAAGPACWMALRLYREFRDCDSSSPLVIEGLALELAAEAGRFSARENAGGPPQWLAKVEGMLRAQFRNPPSLVELAQGAAVHPVHVARSFRRWHRCTCGVFVRRLRLQHAQQQLVVTNAPLSEIALEAGFYDQSHFSRCFRREIGMSPAAFRLRHASANSVPPR